VATSDISKRERQKQRRDAKLEEQRRQAVRARRNRFLVLGLVAVVALAAVGVVVQRRLAERAERQAVIAEAAAQLETLGCTEIETMNDLGGGHLNTDTASLTAADPSVLYPDRPTTSGQHLPAVVLSGVYDEQVDERLLLHNLEHGYVNVVYDEDAPAEQVEALQAFAQEQIDGDYPKMVVSAWGDLMPGDANFAITAWELRQMCRDYDEGVLSAFLTQHYQGEAAPERFIQPHISAEAQGVLDPNAEDGPLLFPPLAEGDQQEEEAANEQPSGSSEAPSEG
jgi:hypothetical protein